MATLLSNSYAEDSDVTVASDDQEELKTQPQGKSLSQLALKVWDFARHSIITGSLAVLYIIHYYCVEFPCEEMSVHVEEDGQATESDSSSMSCGGSPSILHPRRDAALLPEVFHSGSKDKSVY